MGEEQSIDQFKGQSRLPKFATPRRYDLKLKPDLSTCKFTGTLDITVDVVADTRFLVLNAADLTVDNDSICFRVPESSKELSPSEVVLVEEDEILVLGFDDRLPIGDGVLGISFAGTLNDQMRGFYRSTYEYNGEKKNMAVTQFESVDARRCFPCWDEPAFKANFKISLAVPTELVALSNMPVIEEKVDGPVKTLYFEESPVMSTYLVAMVVGLFDYVEAISPDGVTVRVYCQVGKSNQGKFALDVAVQTLDLYKRYFDVPYVLPKLDMVAIPGLKGAHEEKIGSRISDVPNGVEGEHVAAGWPSWLTAVAGEAVKGWLPRRADSFEKLNKIGQGTYSTVYKARDLETGKIVALKKVRFVNMDRDSVRFMAREIYILRRLDHPNVIKLEGLVTSRMSCSLYLVFEYMEHDLAGLSATPGIKFTEPQVKCYMQQLLSGLHHCHTRGVLHRDIKGSNLLIDNNGILKIADFGLATFFNPNQNQPLTSRVVTLWYRPPELLLGATEYGVSVDLWSTGCILAELLTGKPIMPGRTEVEQLHKIFKLCGSPSEVFWSKSKLPHATIFKPQHPYQRRLGEAFRDFAPTTVALLETLLAIEPDARGTAASALKCEFFTIKPLACDPSTLPKYPPSKEFDAKLRDEEARRQRAAAIKGNGTSGREGPREHKALLGTNLNADLVRRRLQENPKTISDKYNAQENGGIGFWIDPGGGKAGNGLMHHGVSVSSRTNKVKDDQSRAVPFHSSTTLGRSQRPDLRTQIPFMSQVDGAGFSNLSGPLAARSTSIKLDGHNERPKHPHWPEHRSGSRYQLEVPDASATHHLLERPSSSHKRNERIGSKESTTAEYGAKRDRIHYSGPLIPPGGNLDEMLKEHERQIQQAVRKARLDKARTKNYGETGLSEALRFRGRNGKSDA